MEGKDKEVERLKWQKKEGMIIQVVLDAIM